MRTRLAFTVLGAALLSTIGCQSAKAPVSTDAKRYDGFGAYHRAISTTSPEAQAWFDQGLQMLYGFNHDEAIRSFRAVTEVDPDCAIAYWGIAYSSGMHINNPEMSEAQSTLAWEASREALSRVDNATPAERSLIRAAAARYEWPIPEDRSHLEQAYADAMEIAWAEHPNDPDIGALYAEALMDLQPWDLWTHDGEPKGRTEEVIVVLERVIEISPDHPGANHFYIHTMEGSLEPERALASADRLTTLVPGSGHLVHMPAHIYSRLGRYDDASDTNVRAIAADRAYFARSPTPDFYSLYFVHNLHFLAYAAMMEGRYEVAMQAARDLEADIPDDFLRDWTYVSDGFMPVTYHVMIRFGKWDEIVAEPAPPEYRLISLAIHHYARGVAFAATGRTVEAAAEMEEFEAVASLIPDDWVVGNNSAESVMAVARQMLIGELAYREGRYDEAFAALRRGVELEEALAYDEPPGWMQPVRHALGALLMGAGRYDEAEAVYQADLQLNLSNGWAMLGLENALKAQNRPADGLAERRAIVWARADVKPTSSCYCEP